MGFAEDQFQKYLEKNLWRLKNITIDEMLPYLADCLSLPTVEKLNAYVRNQGSRKSVTDFYLDLIRGDKWPKYLINALKECKHFELAEEFKEVYASYQLPTNESGPLSLPASLSQHNHQPTWEHPQQSSSRPGQMPSTSLDTQPGPLPQPSQRFNQNQSERQMTERSPSQHNHEFRSLPPFPQDHPAPPRNPLSHNVSEPVHFNGGTVDDKSRNPVPETTPHHTTLPVGDCEAVQKDESSVSENPHIGPDLSPSHKLSPNFKEPLPGKSIKPSSRDVSPIKTLEAQTTLSYSPSSGSDGGGDIGRRQPVHNKDESSVSENPHIGPDLSPSHKLSPNFKEPLPGKSIKPSSRDVSPIKTQKLPEQVPAYITVKAMQKEDGGNAEQREQSDTHEAANLQEHPAPSSRAPSVRKKVVRGNGHPPFQAVDSVADRHPASYHPVNRETVRGEPSRTWQADPWAPSGSSCRPLNSNNEEEYLSKPGALESTLVFADITVVGRGSSEMSHPPDLQISNETEMNESSNATGRSSSPSIAQKKVPFASTPNNKSLKHSPEENDFTIDSRSSPGRNTFDSFSANQPEENSYGSSDVRHYGLHFNEKPEKNLMGSNDDTLRNRLKKSPNTSEPNDHNTQEKPNKMAEGRDRERTVLVTITVASLCLSLYLLWKIQQK